MRTRSAGGKRRRASASYRLAARSSRWLGRGPDFAVNLMLEGAEPFAAGHVKHQVFERELSARRVQVHLAARQHHEMVADEIGVVWIVGDEDHPDPLVSRGLSDIAQHQAGLRYAER